MTFPFREVDIARATDSPLKTVTQNWPHIWSACQAAHLTDIPSTVAIAATIAAECHFAPIEERGDGAYFQRMYGKRVDYEEDARGLWKWRGRGYIQLTGRANYEKYGGKIGVDLLSHPERALEPAIAARIVTAYALDHGLNVWAARGHWLMVRELVNGSRRGTRDGTRIGGYPNGWNMFSEYVWRLLDIAYMR